MDKEVLLIEYMKECYTQARQHETRQTASMSFLTPAAFVVLGIAFGSADGKARNPFACGVIVFIIGLASFWINRTHFKGNRFHVKLAGRARQALENSISGWTIEGDEKPTSIRNRTLQDAGLRGDQSIGVLTYRALRLIPLCVMFLGLATAAYGLVITHTWLLSILRER